MPQVDRTIFRKYDIRGVVSGPSPQITPDLARLVGRALGTYLPQQFQTERLFIGCDNRPSSPAIKEGLIEGAVSAGLNVTDIGAVLTPTVYFASSSYGERGAGVMITGSHLDTRYNGIKMAYGRLALAGQQILDLLDIILNDAFVAGSGSVDQDFDMIHRHMNTIQSKVRIARPLTIVLDAGNGLSGTYVPPILERLGITVHCLYCESDGTYPNHLPNPEDPEMTKDLEAKVVELGADLGLAFDGDADRCGFIDDHGHHIAADRLVALLARDLLSRHPGARVVFDVKASMALPDEIKKYGGIPEMWKTGHSLMKQRMAELGAPLGGEVSGHIFIGEDYYGFDDAPLVALKTLQIVASSDKSISQLFDEIPKLPATPEIILDAPDSVKFQIIEEITQELSRETEVITLDGVRAQFEHGWGLVRASNTQPAITLRFEAYTRPQVRQYMLRFRELLNRHPEVNQDKLDKQIEAFSD
ncbi:MAG: phosphomannomutase/phosphoglucomutase [Aggregatilineales bacterium]